MEYDYDTKQWHIVPGLTQCKDKYQTNPDGHPGKCKLCKYTWVGNTATCTGCGHILKVK